MFFLRLFEKFKKLNKKRRAGSFSKRMIEENLIEECIRAQDLKREKLQLALKREKEQLELNKYHFHFYLLHLEKNKALQSNQSKAHPSHSQLKR